MSLQTVTVVFKIPYNTRWGQSLLISGSEPVLGAWNVKQGLPLTPVHQADELVWCGKLAVANGFKCEYSYYLVDDDKSVLRWETGIRRKLILPEAIKEEIVEIHDLWQTASEAIFLRSAFKDVIFAGCWPLELELPSERYLMNSQKEDMVFKDRRRHSGGYLYCSECNFYRDIDNYPYSDQVSVVGSASQLGQWNAQKGLKLAHVGESIWQVDCVIRKDDLPVKYKYIKNMRNGDSLFETGSNRELNIDLTASHPPNYVYLTDGYFRESPWRGAGVAIPMFSVRSNDGLGVGEFLDLKLLVDWAADSGFHLIQLLPVNDTSVHGMWWDSYPYSSLSVFALHPLYLRLQALSKSIPNDIKQEILIARGQLGRESVDYEATMETKLSIAKKIFSLEKEKTLSSNSFLEFFSANEEWLRPYAAFCFLRDFFDTSDHSQWGRFSTFSKEKLEKIVSKDSHHYDIVCFHYYIQFHLHLQLSEAAAYAKKRKVVLKGDLPIGVDRNSVDTWVYPNLFRMNTSTGAPPDYFDRNGQNWGFPTYNWEAMSKDNYSWWRSRLTQMAKYFTAYRIDHILGFFRIWELPDHAVTGLVGKFRPSLALSQEELEGEGIWDFDRLSHPYIRQEILQDKFGALWPVIAVHFLNEYQKQCYEFKEECNTEKKIIAKLESGVGKSVWHDKENQIQRGLFDLLQNIVLIRDPEDRRKFYPRFNLEETSSFKDLNENSKNVLSRLYYDYYFHRQEDLWRQNALKTLPVLLNSSDMLACGEDLGLIPSCVQPVMEELGLIGLRIQRMPTELGIQFGLPSKYSYMTVCAPSCHDCSTMRAWWEEDEDRRCRFYKNVVGSNKVPPSRCDPGIAHFLLKQHLDAPSMWAIFPLQDLFALREEYTTRPAVQETINDPTNPKHYWRFRVHVTLEHLLGDDKIKGAIKDLVNGSGRSYPTVDPGNNVQEADQRIAEPKMGKETEHGRE